jgi:hypothetical protein
VFDPMASTWSLVPLGPSGTPRVALAVAPEGTPHLAYWSNAGGSWSLSWHTPSMGAETAVPLNGSSLELASQMHSIAVTSEAMNPGGSPHILVVRNLPVPQAHELLYAYRAGGKWAFMPIDQEKVAGANYCNYSPTQPGETCNFDYETIIPIGMVASQGGTVGAVYNKVHRIGTLMANCNDPMFCYWQPSADNSAGEIVVATYAGGALAAKSTVGANALIQSATAAIDTIGRIHIAVYESPPGQSGTTVRYLLVGP